MNRYWLDGVDLPNLKQPPVSALVDFETPRDCVFSLNHMGVPAIDRHNWKVTIKGLVDRRITFGLHDLRGMRQYDVCAFHECAGHPFHPSVPVRRVANVVWRGVALREVLALAGVKPQAAFMWSAGADGGNYHGTEIPAFVKDLPLEELSRDDILLALQLNGEELDDTRGGPVRLVVPGYYGTNSTKWLVSLDLQAARSPGYFTTVMYNDRKTLAGREVVTPVWRVAPHSLIVSPAHEAVIAVGAQTLIFGWAWGADPIEVVEVSVDGGACWRTAQVEPRRQHSWQRFSCAWSPASSGTHRLQCRAIDIAGRGQPLAEARNCIFSIEVLADQST
ncbi:MULTISPECIES: molybdopterin-dependent oxidoreductase [Rhizobium]|uniref:molybdopterin-dependent oxidoreductase n=1 Tax=Rhizobium TaxID=379 RepID=UPI000375C11F|nr:MULTISPECIES: molybdopterin-dependent oxidoreductase [Rhizobium]KAF5886194.1 molybdopterin-dependent oxidoreductase [Rhizobium sp. PEPV16]